MPAGSSSLVRTACDFGTDVLLPMSTGDASGSGAPDTFL